MSTHASFVDEKSGPLSKRSLPWTGRLGRTGLFLLMLFALWQALGMISAKNAPQQYFKESLEFSDPLAGSSNKIVQQGWKQGRTEVHKDIIELLTSMMPLIWGLAAIFVYTRARPMFRQRTRQASRSERNKSDPAETYQASSAQVSAGMPRHLRRNPFDMKQSSLSLEERVELAIVESQRAGGRVGAILYHFRRDQLPLPANVSNVGSADPEETIASLRSKLRPTDYAGLLGDDRIVVFVCLLKNRNDLVSIASRLNGHLHDIVGSKVSGIAIDYGIAMNPIDGYTASDLVMSAHKDIKSRLVSVH